MTAVESAPVAKSVSEPKIWTEDEIQNLPDNGYNYEIVGGELSMSPKNNPEHSLICTEISSRLHAFCRKHRLGYILDSNAGFWMVNRNLRAPDVSYVRRERMKGISRKSFFQGAPDLAIEVLSSTNRRGDMNDRLRDFFSSGTKIAWIIDPERRFAEVCYSLTNRKLVGPGGILEGEDVLPGFTLPLDELFEDWNEPMA